MNELLRALTPEQRDPGSGSAKENERIQFNRNRHYAPRHGRWLQREPLGYVDGMNLYQYVRSRPLRFGDPTGLRGRDPSGRRGRDDDRRDRRRRDRDRRRRPFSDFNSDWAGRLILDLYLSGWGENNPSPYIADGPRWKHYMESNELLRGQVNQKLQMEALRICKTRGPAPAAGYKEFPIELQFHATVENGEGIIGYNYLHGTNADVGDFQISGRARKWMIRKSDGSCCCQVGFKLYYVWNDIIDPNGKYWSDTVKNAFAETITFGDANPYKIKVVWKDNLVLQALQREGRVDRLAVSTCRRPVSSASYGILAAARGCHY